MSSAPTTTHYPCPACDDRGLVSFRSPTREPWVAACLCSAAARYPYVARVTADVFDAAVAGHKNPVSQPQSARGTSDRGFRC